MSDQRSLFDASRPSPAPAPRPEPVRPAAPVEEPTLTVSGLNRMIASVLRQGASRAMWIKGEITGYRKHRNGHVYFDLAEKDHRSSRPKARIAAVLWAGDQPAVAETMRAVPGFRLQEDIEVRILGRVDFFAPLGKVQIQVLDIDPTFTLGQIAAERERILRSLREEGLLDLNRAHPVPAAPVEVGVITSVGSAAYNDFCDVVQRSGLGIRVRAYDARVQGTDTEATVCRGLAYFARHRPDVVVLIRGGGSRGDLAGFDSERIARAIAALPVPVWTGIGHEIDRAVADEVAHTSFITPTACAREVVRRVEETRDRAENAWAGIQAATTTALGAEADALREAARELARRTRAGLRHRDQHLGHLRTGIRREAVRSTGRRDATLREHTRTLALTTRGRLARHRDRLDDLAAQLRPARVAAPLNRAQRRCAELTRDLRRAAGRALTTATRDLDLKASQVAAADPARALARGFSLTYDAAGNLVRDPAGVPSGSRLRTRVAQGEIQSVVVDPDREES